MKESACSLRSETDSTDRDLIQIASSSLLSYPNIEDIDYDMDTTEYEVYRDYVDDEADSDEGVGENTNTSTNANTNFNSNSNIDDSKHDKNKDEVEKRKIKDKDTDEEDKEMIKIKYKSREEIKMHESKNENKSKDERENEIENGQGKKNKVTSPGTSIDDAAPLHSRQDPESTKLNESDQKVDNFVLNMDRKHNIGEENEIREKEGEEEEGKECSIEVLERNELQCKEVIDDKEDKRCSEDERENLSNDQSRKMNPIEETKRDKKIEADTGLMMETEKEVEREKKMKMGMDKNEEGKNKNKDKDSETGNDSMKIIEKSRQPVSFPLRLFDVVAEEDSNVIGWRDNGTSFRIFDVASFVTNILFRRFKCKYLLLFGIV